MNIRRVLILDGYTDEPAGLGVPPYIDVYPRYIAGAIWSVDKTIHIRYITVDEVRKDIHRFLREAQTYDLVIIVAGVTVPGKYLGGTPIKLEELEQWFRIISRPLKILVGPAARFGIGLEGGRVAALPSHVKENFDVIVQGDPELYVHELLTQGLEKADPHVIRRTYELTNKFAIKGTKIVRQHPNYGLNLIAEIETYRGCPRAITGGCSFCIEPGYGLPVFREPKDIVDEVKALYMVGVRHFRLGRQPDILAYKAIDSGKEEFPRPNIVELRKLFHGIRSVAPEIETLHIDNVNPGTIVHHEVESRDALKVIVEYHTPGDVAALGVETADPRVVKLNNLKVYPDEAFKAIKIVNEIGSKRGWNGLPELLPGINFVYGLIGETKETYRLNYEFMKKVLDAGLLVRRINIRQVIAFPTTRMWKYGDSIIKKHKNIFRVYRDKIRKEIDLPMLRRVVPRGTILRKVFTETYSGKHTLARQVGSYPLLVNIPMKLELHKWIDVVVVDHGYRSVTGIPYPLNVNTCPLRILQLVPGISRSEVLELAKNRPIRSYEELRRIVNSYSVKYLTI